jgi:hypothetical protein
MALETTKGNKTPGIGQVLAELIKVGKKVNLSRYRPKVANGVSRGMAVFFLNLGTRRGWVVSYFTPRKIKVGRMIVLSQIYKFVSSVLFGMRRNSLAVEGVNHCTCLKEG